jgi:predicted DNA-binding transcriptional regulator AlpA
MYEWFNTVKVDPKPSRRLNVPHDRLTTTEVSALTGIPAATLRYYRYLGTGPRSYRLGRTVVYDRADLDEWINEQKKSTAAGGTAAARRA